MARCGGVQAHCQTTPCHCSTSCTITSHEHARQPPPPPQASDERALITCPAVLFQCSPARACVVNTQHRRSHMHAAIHGRPLMFLNKTKDRGKLPQSSISDAAAAGRALRRAGPGVERGHVGRRDRPAEEVHVLLWNTFLSAVSGRTAISCVVCSEVDAGRGGGYTIQATRV